MANGAKPEDKLKMNLSAVKLDEKDKPKLND